MKQIRLSGKYGKGRFAMVDDEDFEYLNEFRWHQCWRGYAKRSVVVNGKRMPLTMHQIIMSTPAGMDTDHIDGNRLNNQKGNLRICTHSQNMMNARKSRNSTSRFKGVIIVKDRQYTRYRSRIIINGKSVVKQFPFTPEGELQAAQLYNELAKAHFKEFARLNTFTAQEQEYLATAKPYKKFARTI